MELRICREFLPEAWELYESSFPYYERRTLERHKEVLLDPAFSPYHIEENGQFIGLLYVWQWGDYCFGEHLAVRVDLRGGGYGAKAVKAWQEMMNDKLVMLEIDPPVTEIAQRRQGFYERLGLQVNPYEHLHPSYGLPREEHLLLVMSWPRLMTESEFAEFRRYTLSKR